MHDPLTVAWEIRAPWFKQDKHFPKGRYHPSLVTIWHVDPEADGSDDSCGWSRPRLTAEQRKTVRALAWGEARAPWFQWAYAKTLQSPTDAETLCRAAILQVAGALDLRVSFEEATAWAIELVHSPMDNIRGSLCFIPGWHSNFEEDREQDREEAAAGLFSIIAQFILRRRRPWYKHPRFHVHHWKVQFHMVQRLKRWLFSRCAVCKGRFRYGEAPTSTSWGGSGPRWFRGEPHVRHRACAVAALAEEVKNAFV